MITDKHRKCEALASEAETTLSASESECQAGRMTERIVVKEEKILSIYEEIEQLAKRNYEEANFQHYLGAMNIKKEQYAMFQEDGNLLFFTFRKNGVLVGYAFYIVMLSNMGSNFIAENGAFYLVPEERKGLTANNLLKETEKLLKGKGVNLLIHKTRMEHDLSSFFERAGFEFSEKVYTKVLGE